MGSKKKRDRSNSSSSSSSSSSVASHSSSEQEQRKKRRSHSEEPERSRKTRNDDRKEKDKIEKSRADPSERHNVDNRHDDRYEDRRDYRRNYRFDRRDNKDSRDYRSNRDNRDWRDRRDDRGGGGGGGGGNGFRGNGRDDRRYQNQNRNRSRERNNRDNYRRRRSKSGSFDHANAKWGKDDDNKKQTKQEPAEKQKPNFGLSGKLTEETNTYRGVVIKYSEPPEARKPKRRWRLYPFKGDKALQTLYIHRESAYLIGRDRKVVDLPVDHPSCSKQHAALQYRLVPFTREDGTAGKRVRPYLIDLDSANGTYINNKRIESKKYVELLEKDIIKFGYSSREYVLLHENSKDEDQDDDVKQEEDLAPVKKEEPE